MLLSLSLINTSDALAKWTIQDLPIFQIMVFQACGLVVMALLVSRQPNPLRLIRTADPGWQIARSACQFAMGFTFYSGLRVLQFADLIAILFIGPLVITAMAHVFLNERVGWHRWAACAVGLVGGLVIVRPGSGLMGWGRHLAGAGSRALVDLCRHHTQDFREKFHCKHDVMVIPGHPGRTCGDEPMVLAITRWLAMGGAVGDCPSLVKQQRSRDQGLHPGAGLAAGALHLHGNNRRHVLWLGLLARVSGHMDMVWRHHHHPCRSLCRSTGSLGTPGRKLTKTGRNTV